jgi:putative membrane protein
MSVPELAPVRPEAVGDDGYAWRRMHPVTPLLRGWKIIAAVLIIASTQFTGDIRGAARLLGGDGWVVVLGGFVVIALLAVAWSFVSWRVTRYAVTDEAVHLRQGIVFRQQRQARLDRLQAIDVVQPLLARLVGLSELRLEVAGGSGSRVSLAFLREAEADALRAELLALAAGLRRPGAGGERTTNGAAPGAVGMATGLPAGPDGRFAQPGAGGPGGSFDPAATWSPDPAAGSSYGSPAAPPDDPSATGVPTYAGARYAATSSPATTRRRGAVTEPAFATAPEHLVYELPMPRLLGSIILSGGTVWFLLFIVVIVVMISSGAPFEAIYSLVPMAFALVSFFWQRINGTATFRAATSPDGIRLRHGLLETRSQTLPPGRVQAVRLRQPLLWRGKDWWKVEVNVAGYAGDRDKQGTESVLHPVATRDEALLALWLVLPDLGADDPRAAVEAGLVGMGDAGGYTAAPRRSRWVDPVGWRRHGVLVTRRALLLRSGRFWRRLDVVPHERTQSLSLEQGPLQRALKVASVAAHSTHGPVVPRIEHLDTAVAVALLEEQAERARHARRTAAPEQWMRSQ